MNQAATRPDWDEYFLDIARAVAARATCSRAQHGAVIVNTNYRIVGTGYNGAPAGNRHCIDGGCPRGKLSYEDLGALGGGYDDPKSPGFCVAVHAETNAILQAGRQDTFGATIYITGAPCHGCARLIEAAGIARTVFGP